MRRGIRPQPMLALVTALYVLLLPLAGCRQDLQDQPKFYPQRRTSFYADGRSVRSQVTGTVARSQGTRDDYLHTGMMDGKEGDSLPYALTTDVMRRGQERYNIYCSPCHSRVGNGLGLIVARGYHPAASFHTFRLRNAPLSHFFAVMTNGFGAMPNYAAELTTEDRWAVAAYIRALQLSQNASRADLPAGQQARKLDDIQASQGFAKNFLKPWFPVVQTFSAAATSSVSIRAPSRVAPVPVQQKDAPVAVSANSGSSASSVKARPAEVSTTTMSGTSKQVQATEQASTNNSAPKETATLAHDSSSGKMLYMRNCAGCHGISRTGLPPNIPSLIGIVTKDGEERVRSAIANGVPSGKPPMPAFVDRLSAEDVVDLLAFLKSD